jgi:hypothetical protein
MDAQGDGSVKALRIINAGMPVEAATVMIMGLWFRNALIDQIAGDDRTASGSACD